MPSSHHDLLILEIKRTRQVALATGIARTGTGAPNLLLAASLATGPGATDEPTAVWLSPCFCSSTLTHALDDRFTALLAERAGLDGGFALVFALGAGSRSRSLDSFSRGDMMGGFVS
ncbi:hypothetical protein NPX13_g5920 [Xylaria arbuscula]|uniref:Uncharacterized protein n=1 Tax=Xylaria arbuscula TaxID=114810 RepID=A0A9W8NDN0_9PEZI|nr:hypothetical protein NPX13_g5920 [Xylaria arbuscula]